MAIQLLLFLTQLMLICSATDVEHLSSSSAQIKFWHENVLNKMPDSILKKLSPLTKQNCDTFTSLISKNNKFTADSDFCSLAKLSCTTFDAPISSSKQSCSITLTYTYRCYRFDSKDFITRADNAKTNENAIFFRLSILKAGNLVKLPNTKSPAPCRAFLPAQIASHISLGPTNKIFKIFPDSAFGAAKEAIESTLDGCNTEAIRGETKSCLRSLEEMISFAKSTLGGKKLLALTSGITEKYSNGDLVIKNVKKVTSDKNVVCHDTYLPFSAYFCHLIHSTSLYEVDFVEPKTGAPASTLVAICHMDTSAFPAGHVSLQTLKLSPGQGEVCHWIPQTDLAWINANEN